MSFLDPLIALAFIVIAVFLVDAVTHHWLSEIALYTFLSVLGATTSFFVYGGFAELGSNCHQIRRGFNTIRSTIFS